MTITEKVEQKDFDRFAAGKRRSIKLTEGAAHEGDTMILEEWDIQAQAYTGRKIETLITAVRSLPSAAEWAATTNSDEQLQQVQFELKLSKYTPAS
jgi:hypothetical protein